MSLRNLLLGRPLASHEEGEQRVGPVAGIPMLGLDALSSAAYGPEAAMTLLIPLGAAGLGYIGPISTIIIVLLLIVYLSYRQTIGAYPTGGGSYTVARRNRACSRDCWPPQRCCWITCSSWPWGSRRASARWSLQCRRSNRTRCSCASVSWRSSHS